MITELAYSVERTAYRKSKKRFLLNAIRYPLYAMLVVLCVAGCAKKDLPKPDANKTAADANADPVKHKVMSFSLEGMNERGTKKWDVKGESAEAVSESKVKLNTITANAYGESSQATITARKGLYDKTRNNVRLEDDVKATIDTEDGSTQGFADFTGLAQAKTGPKEGEGPKKSRTVITCDGEAQFDYDKSIAYFNRNVKVFSSDGNIDADKIIINLDPATKKVYEIVAEGNVKILRGENITYSEKATYVESEKKIILTGQPKLVIYQEGSIKDNLLGG